jgi:hypothetical protein
MSTHRGTPELKTFLLILTSFEMLVKSVASKEFFLVYRLM